MTKMNENLVVTHKVCDSAFLINLIELGKTYYNEDSLVINLNFLNWLYLDNPNGAAEMVFVKDGELLVGIVALIPIMLESKEIKQDAFFAVNVLTHPLYRGKNLFGRMIEKIKELMSNKKKWLIGHPNSNAIKGWTKYSMQFREPLVLFMNKYKLSNLWKFEKTRIENIAQLMEIKENFWRGLAEKANFHVQYTPEFLAWRFLDSVGKNYTITKISQRGNLLGLVITRKYKLCFDLLIDVIAKDDDVDKVLGSLVKPTLIAAPSKGEFTESISKVVSKLPLQKSFPFFVTTWSNDFDPYDFSGVTFSASDF